MAYIISAKDTTSAAYGVCYSLNITAATEGKSQREIAKEIGVSSGTISWHSVQFKKFAGIKV
jgi:predicted transcriptional regulator